MLNKKPAASGPHLRGPPWCPEVAPSRNFYETQPEGRKLKLFLQSSGGWFWTHEQANFHKWSMKNSTCCEALGELAAHTSAWPFSFVFCCPKVEPPTRLMFAPSETFIQAWCVAECRYCPAVGPLNCNVDYTKLEPGQTCKCNTTAKLFDKRQINSIGGKTTYTTWSN